MRKKKRLWLVLMAVLLGISTCFACAAWSGKRVLNWISFEIAWRVVQERHFDRTFGGVDWRALHTAYRRQILLASDAAYYRLVNEMLWQLDVSHLAMVPPSYWPQVEPTVLAEGSTGLDVRWLDGEAVITSVEPGSPADRAGLRPGLAIERIDGRAVDAIASDAELGMEPPYNERHRVEAVTSGILGRIYGPEGTRVAIAYRDEEGTARQVRLERAMRPGKTRTGSGFPASFVEFESRRLKGGIGYLSFNWFDQTLVEELPRAIRSMRDAPGLIIDLRGNPGGMRDAAVAGAEQLVSERVQCSTLQRKEGLQELFLDPARKGYEGPVVVLIDVMSKSSSEFFAGCTQAIGRSVVVGERSPGSVGPAELMALPNGAGFIYPVAQETTVDGTALEGHGVIPDIQVALDRALLSQGIDSQLEAAIGYLEGVMQASK